MLTWYDACVDAVEQPFDKLRVLTIALGTVVVSALAALLVLARHLARRCEFSRLFAGQSAAFVVCAAASGWMFWRWKRLDAADRSRVWKHYGWFSGLMSSGCILGAVAQPAWAAFLIDFYGSRMNANDADSSLWAKVPTQPSLVVTQHAVCL